MMRGMLTAVRWEADEASGGAEVYILSTGSARRRLKASVVEELGKEPPPLLTIWSVRGSWILRE